MNIKVSRNGDPFKKYWWVLLVVFGVLAVIACLPSLQDGPGGAAVADASGEGGLASADGSNASLDPSQNPNGARGGAIDLSMDGAGGARKHGAGDSMMSSLYQAPGADDASASGAKTTAAASADLDKSKKLADSLRDISRRSAASAKADATGWGGEKAQRGFTAPKASFGALSGLGSASGAGGASFGGAVGGGSIGGGFGDSKAKTGTAYTRGLGNGREDTAAGHSANAALASLKTVSNAVNAAARTNNADLAKSMGGRSFDGGGGSGEIRGGGTADGAGGLNNLSAAPINLKPNDEKMDSFKFEAAPAPVKTPDTAADQRKQLEKAIIMAVVMGVVGAACGGVAAAVMGPVMQQMMSQDDGKSKTQDQNDLKNMQTKNQTS